MFVRFEFVREGPIVGAIQVAPAALHPNIGFINTPGFIGWLEMTVQPLLEFRPVALNPSPDRSVG